MSIRVQLDDRDEGGQFVIISDQLANRISEKALEDNMTFGDALVEVFEEHYDES